MVSPSDSQFLLSALALAKPRRGFAAPNPAVGAVVVQSGEVIGTGFHWGAGHPHAEVGALGSLGERARGATIYVTLEPCCHWGRTPPCTDLLIRHGVREVVYGFEDPNPKVTGKGARQLAEAGILCRRVSLPEIEAFYRSYAWWTRTGRSWVTAKLALSLDAKIAGEGGRRQNITGEAIGRWTHECRNSSDAILTTARTIIADNPRLDARTVNGNAAKPLYVIDRFLSTPPTAEIFRTGAPLTFLHGSDAPSEKARSLESQGAHLLAVSTKANGPVNGIDLEKVLEAIGQRGTHDLWVEAGGRLFTALVSQRLANQIYLYFGARFLGASGVSAFADSTGLDEVLASAVDKRWREFGADAFLEVRW